MRLQDHCADLTRIVGTPPLATRPGFALECRAPPPAFDFNKELRWVDGATLDVISKTSLGTLRWEGGVTVLRGRAFAYLPNQDDPALMSQDGDLSTVPVPGLDQTWERDPAPSGARILRMTLQEYLVLDLSTRTLALRIAAHGAYYTVRSTRDGAVQLVGAERDGACAPAAPDHCGKDAVLILDAATGQVRRVAIPEGFAGVPEPYGERQMLLTLLSRPSAHQPRNLAVLDLDQGRIVWSGAHADAPPADSFACGPIQNIGDSFDPFHLPLHVSLRGEGFIVQQGGARRATICAVTGDGRRLAIVAPPFIHYYAIDPKP